MAARRKNQNRQAIDGRSQLLRTLPSIDECLRVALRDPALSGLAHEYLRLLLRRAQVALRTSLASAEVDTALTDSGAAPAAGAFEGRAARTNGGAAPVHRMIEGARAAVLASAESGADPTREAADIERAQVKGGRVASTREALVEEIVRIARAAAAADGPSLRAVINATGVVLHTNLGRALLAEPAIEAIVNAARSPVNLEYDLASGGRGDRDSIVEEELCALTGAEAATVVNNNAAAVLLALNSIADGREVIVSRGELIEIGGSFRIPDVMGRSGARLREVGTTNRTHPGDYAAAIGPDTAMLLKVHPSNYRIVGFTAEVTLAEMVQIGNAHNLPVMEDLGSGALIDMALYGLPREPMVAERVAAGAGLVTFSGDKLLGGPQAGLIVGRRDLIERLKANPLRRALRCDKLTLAAIAATLRLYQRSPDLGAVLPTLRMMRRTPAELESVAIRAREILLEILGKYQADRIAGDFTIEVVVSASEIGSGALPTEEIESRALRITHREHSPDTIAALFRHARPPVIGRITDGAFHLDLRTVEDPTALAVALPHRI
jgi:L-seryl-tRNA(Ser) seleniumtransferase